MSEGHTMKSTYDQIYARWLDDPESFWADGKKR